MSKKKSWTCQGVAHFGAQNWFIFLKMQYIDYIVPYVQEKAAERMRPYYQAWKQGRYSDALMQYYDNETALPGSRLWKRGKRALEEAWKMNDKVNRIKRGRSKSYKIKSGMLPNAPTEVSSTMAYVDLGVINLNRFAKGGRRGDKVDLRSLEIQRNVNNYEKIRHTAPTDKRFFSTVFKSESIGDNNPRDGGGLVQGSVGFPTAAAVGKFNSVQQLIEIFNDRTLNKPTLSHTINEHPVREVGDSNELVCLWNQQTILHIKNITANEKGGVGSGVYSNAPIHVNMFVVQFKEDIYHNEPDISTLRQVLNDHIIQGWQSEYNDLSSVPIPIANNQNVHVSWKDNTSTSKWDVKASRKFILAPGQEAQLKVVLTVPQILSFKFMQKLVVGDVDAGPPVNYKYLSPVHKKGEMMLLFDFHAGLCRNNANSVEFEKGEIGIYGFQKYEWGVLDSEFGNVQKRIGKDPAAPTGIISSVDADIRNLS